MTETHLAHGYSSESTQHELSNEYQHDRLGAFKKSLHPCTLDESNHSIRLVNNFAGTYSEISLPSVVWILKITLELFMN